MDEMPWKWEAEDEGGNTRPRGGDEVRVGFEERK
jgi:hypothetical protein